MFTVRSAYHLVKEIQDNMAAQSFISREDQDVWKPLWALIVPNAVKNFAWRACHEVLPTRVNLRKRKIVDVATCPCCETAKETLIHVIWACPAAQDVCGSHLSYFHKCNWVVSSFNELFAKCLQQFARETVELMTMVARAIWFRRNKLIFYGHFQHPDETYRGALKSLEDSRMSKQLEIIRQLSLGNLGQNPHVGTWCPPPPSTVKINFDAALDVQQGYVGVGLIAWDHMGLFLGARNLVHKLKVQAKIAEFIAALGAVLFNKEAGFLDVIFKVDAKQVVSEINSDPLPL